MRRTRQDVYASNLLRAQDFGYPLRNPRPKDPSDSEGLQVGDVGYVDGDGKFNWVLNIGFPPNGLQNQIPSFHLPLPVGRREFKPGEVFMSGVKRILDVPGYFHITVVMLQFLHSDIPRADYAFVTTEREGAILILPDGASRWELDEAQVPELETHVKKYALQICRFAKEGPLYLVTGVVKSKSWTLGSFCNGSGGSEIFVRRSSSNVNGTFTYQWVSETNVDNQQGPQNNHYLNQTVLLKGFKIMRKGGWLPSIALGKGERS